MHSISLALLCLVLYVTQQGINALTCYSCTRGSDGCGSSFSKTGAGVTTITDAGGLCCTKLVATSNTNSISRTYSTTTDVCASSTNTDGSVTVNQYVCTTDLCNESSIKKTSLLFSIITTIIGLILVK